MSSLQNVVPIGSHTTVFNHISNWIKTRPAENTRTTYELRIREYFEFVRGKKIEFLTQEDLTTRRDEFLGYIAYLSKNHVKNGSIVASSVNGKATVIRKLMKELAISYKNIDLSVFEYDSIKDNSNGSDPLTEDEIVELIALSLEESRKPFEKSVYVELSYVTAFRLSAKLELKWTDIVFEDGVYALRVKEKGNKEKYQAISNELYDKLMLLKEQNKDSEYIFTISKRTAQDFVQHIAYTKMGINKDVRKITDHSIRKGSANAVHDATGDVEEVREHLNHSDLAVTSRYLKKRRKLSSLPSNLILRNSDLEEQLNEMSKEEIIDLLTKCNVGIKASISRQLKAKGTSR